MDVKQLSITITGADVTCIYLCFCVYVYVCVSTLLHELLDFEDFYQHTSLSQIVIPSCSIDHFFHICFSKWLNQTEHVPQSFITWKPKWFLLLTAASCTSFRISLSQIVAIICHCCTDHLYFGWNIFGQLLCVIVVWTASYHMPT